MFFRTRSLTKLFLKLTFACSVAFIYIQIQLLPITKRNHFVRALTSKQDELPPDQVVWSEICKSKSTIPDQHTNSSIKLNVFRWNEIRGSSINSLIKQPWFPRQPTVMDFASCAKVVLNGLHYGQWIVGYLHVDVTGDYMFGISSDDSSEFWLSSDDTPDNAQRVAMVGNGHHTKYFYQITDPIPLQKCKKYFIEILHKQSDGKSFVALSWKRPGYEKFFVVSGTYLSPLLPMVPSVKEPAEVIFNKALETFQRALYKQRMNKVNMDVCERFLMTRVKRLKFNSEKRSMTSCKLTTYKNTQSRHRNSIASVYPLLPSNTKRTKGRGDVSSHDGSDVMSEKTAKAIIGEYLPLMEETFHSG